MAASRRLAFALAVLSTRTAAAFVAPALTARADCRMLRRPECRHTVAVAIPERAYGPHLAVKGKVLNWFGALYMVQAVALGAIWSMSMLFIWAVARLTGLDKQRKLYDLTGRIWSRTNMWVGGCAPRLITGKHHVPQSGGCLLVANHASWFDIPMLALAVPRGFKFVASKELGKLPLIGQQLRGGKHVLIDRSSRRGHLSAFKESVGWLNSGMPVMAFPEGTRSRNGRLNKFKGGVFSMATKTNSPIIPISIVGAFSTFPPNLLMPIGPDGGKLEVHIHPPISVDGKTEDELAQLTREAILSKLPPESHPLQSQPQEAAVA